MLRVPGDGVDNHRTICFGQHALCGRRVSGRLNKDLRTSAYEQYGRQWRLQQRVTSSLDWASAKRPVIPLTSEESLIRAGRDDPEAVPSRLRTDLFW